MQKQKSKSSQSQNQPQPEIPPALKVFSKTRDIESSNPYHLDGNMEMYNEQQIKEREQLSKDPDIIREIEQIIKMYDLVDGKIKQEEYKSMQKRMALALRPDIEQEQLQFVVNEDWILDSKEGQIQPKEMVHKIFEMVDVWTLGVDKMQYITFIKLLAKKIAKKK